MAKEQEVKLAAADASVLRAVLRDPRLAGRVEVFQMDTTYYDLGDYYKEQHWVLRLRRENGVPIVTMKTPGTIPATATSGSARQTIPSWPFRSSLSWARRKNWPPLRNFRPSARPISPVRQ